MPGPLPPVPNVLQVRVQGSIGGGGTWENVLNTQYSGTAPTAATCVSIANAWQIAWAQHMAPEVISVHANTGVQVTDLSSASGGQGSSLLATAGTRGDDPIGANSAALISYPVPTRYRGGKPRHYLLVGGFADLADSVHWTSAFVTEYETHWNAFVAAVVGQTFSGTTITQNVALRRRGKFLPNEGPPDYVLTTPIVMPLAANSAGGNAELASMKDRIGRRSK